VTVSSRSRAIVTGVPQPARDGQQGNENRMR
jgi:hypothetical protein